MKKEAERNRKKKPRRELNTHDTRQLVLITTNFIYRRPEFCNIFRIARFWLELETVKYMYTVVFRFLLEYSGKLILFPQ